MRKWLAVFAVAVACGGCVERTMTVHSQPEGALVYMQDQEIGRTPFTRNFIWYGVYDVQVRKEGYQTLKTGTPVFAPFWQWVPFDLMTEMLPLRLQDAHRLDYTLKPLPERTVDPDLLTHRGLMMRNRLESSQVPQTQPTTKPAKKNKTK